MALTKPLLETQKPPDTAKKRGRKIFFYCPNLHHDVRDWAWSMSYRDDEETLTLEGALATVKAQILKVYALPEITPADARKKSQSLKACFDILASILAHGK